MKLLVIAAYLSSSLAAPLSSYLLSHDPSTASPAESIALSELTEYFKQITDQEPVVLPPAAAAGKLQIAVGYSAAIFQSEIGPDTFTDFGLDGFVAQTTKDGSIVLSGSNDEASKGTLYSTLHFLNEIGVEWYASDEVSTPPPETAIPDFNVAIPKLPLEYVFERSELCIANVVTRERIQLILLGLICTLCIHSRLVPLPSTLARRCIANERTPVLAH